MDTCQFHMMWMEMAKRQWAQEQAKSSGDIPTEAELMSYMREITPKWCGIKHRRKAPSDHLPECVITDLPYAITPVGTPMECPRREVHERQAGWMEPALAFHYKTK